MQRVKAESNQRIRVIATREPRSKRETVVGPKGTLFCNASRGDTLSTIGNIKAVHKLARSTLARKNVVTNSVDDWPRWRMIETK